MSRLAVAIKHPDRATYWLASNPWEYGRYRAELVSDSWSITRNQQTVSGAEWDLKKFFDRGNRSLAIDISVNREFPGEFERADFLAALAADSVADELHKWSGFVFLRWEEGDEWEQRRMDNAIISLTGLENVGGVSLSLRYRIQAGGITKDLESDGLYEWLLDVDGEPLLDVDGMRLAGTEHEG